MFQTSINLNLIVKKENELNILAFLNDDVSFLLKLWVFH